MKIDLRQGVVPVSKASSRLAALIRRAQETGQVQIITQKGRPSAALISIDLLERLVDTITMEATNE